MELDNVEFKKNEAWEAGLPDHKLLAAEGAVQYFKKEFPDLKHAFLKDLGSVVCMDEGCAHKDINGEGKFCMAGSGLLYPAANEEVRIKAVAELFSKIGAVDITSHGGCGAAGLAYKRDFPDSNPTAEQIEDYGKDWAKKVAAEMGRLGHEESYTHILAEDMERPIDFHTARIVYYDNVGGFNPNKEVGLPMGFVIERKFETPEYALEELQVAANIAFGHHGFGSRFTQDFPFVIIVFAGNEAELASIKKEAEAALAENQNYREGKIKIDGMII
jgi:hypothetical protein